MSETTSDDARAFESAERAAGMLLTASSFVFGLTVAFATPDARTSSWWVRGTLLAALFPLGISTLMTAYAALAIAWQGSEEAIKRAVGALNYAWWAFGFGVIALLAYSVFAIV